MNRTCIGFSILLAHLSTICVHGAEKSLPPQALMEKAAHANLGTDETHRLKLVLVDKRGNKRVRELTKWYKRANDGKEQILIRFREPDDIAGTALLIHQPEGAKSEQWLYLPLLKRVKRIVTSDSSSYFASTDFTYQDLKIEELSNFDYTGVQTERIDGRSCRKITALPKNPATARRTGYGKRILWIDPASYVIRQVHYFDSSGRMTKTLHATGFEEFSGKMKATRIVMDNIKRKHRTYVKLEDLRVDGGLEDRRFTQAGMSE